MKVTLDCLHLHPYLEGMYEQHRVDDLMLSMERTGLEPVNPIVVTPKSEGGYFIISGRRRLEALLIANVEEYEVMVLDDLDDDNSIESLIVDLNKQRFKSGRELLMEFRHFDKLHDKKRGQPGRKYELIAKEINKSPDWVKGIKILDNFFMGLEGDVVMENVLGGNLAPHQATKIKKAAEKYPEQFNSKASLEKLCNRQFDFDRLSYALQFLKLDDDSDFKLIEGYLLRNYTLEEFNKLLFDLNKINQVIDDHNTGKVDVQELTSKYSTENSCLILGDNREASIELPFGTKIKCLIGSPPYGDRRLNGDDPETETGHHMNGEQYASYLADTYQRYIPYLESDGSVYVIIDDFKSKDGSLACSLEHFVVEMTKRGFFLASRYSWIKANPMPRRYNGKNMVNGMEMIYRFVLDPKNYFSNPDLFLELDIVDSEKLKVSGGCTNHDNDGTSNKGSLYIQSHLKKVRNTLGEQDCIDVIRGNAANPEDFFRQVEEKKHTSTAPIYLTAVLVLESTRPGEVVCDIWNGVASTGVSALLLQRKYVGIEKEGSYFQQSCRRMEMTEGMIQEAGLASQEVPVISLDLQSPMAA